MGYLSTIEIDLGDFEASVRKLDALDNAVQIGFKKGLDELADKMYSYMEERLVSFGLIGARIASTVSVNRSGEGILISVGADYAKYVEYGTGIVGAENPHPKDPWEYDVNSYGEDGWFYYDESHKLHWTAGQPSRHFVYDTWLYGSRIYTQIINKNIRAELKRRGIGGKV